MSLLAPLLCVLGASSVSASDQIYFPSVTDVTSIIAQKIDAEPPSGRIDVGIWLFSENIIAQALLRAKTRGVQIRLLGDRAAIFEGDVNTKNTFYSLACAGVPIRLRYSPDW